MTWSNVESEEWETVTDIWEAAGWVKDAVEIITIFYTAGRTSPIESALQHIARELDRINGNLLELGNRLNTVTQRLVEAENRIRINAVNEHVIPLTTLAFQIQTSPTDRTRIAEAAFEAGARADDFLTDRELWLWSDVRIVTPLNQWGEPDLLRPRYLEAMPPDFKTTLALPVYAMALMTWMTAIALDAGGDWSAVRDRYADQLERHIAATTIRYGWRDDGTVEAETVAEQIRSRITCQPMPVSKYAVDGQCTFTVQCSDTIQRTRQVIREFSVAVDDPNPQQHMCTIHPEVVLQDESELEEQDPALAGLMKLHEMLRSVAASGRLPQEQFVGVFPNWTAVIIELYGVASDFQLDFFTKILPSEDGVWDGPTMIGTGWDVAAIVPGGGRVMYAVKATGIDTVDILWFDHEGSFPGTGPSLAARWGTGAAYWDYFGSGYGVIYRLCRTLGPLGSAVPGDLQWARHENYQTGQGMFSDLVKVGNGWGDFTTVFSCGKGVIYGVMPDGALRWHCHRGWQTGSLDWDQARILDTGVDWNRFERVVGARDGVILGVLPNGIMHLYRHVDWENGGPRFEGPHTVGDFWRRYNPIFAGMPAEGSSVN